ncbi:hypothetical protein J2789_001044, partial [Variovorax paradoxus]|nr:hypothetical protein [Variovorax paradoxus]
REQVKTALISRSDVMCRQNPAILEQLSQTN